MTGSSSAVLLATVGSLRSGDALTALTQAHRARLKAALELPGAAIAVTGGGEYLGVYGSLGIALEAAMSFQIAADELADGSPLAFTGRVVLDLWPVSVENMPVEHAREILHHAREHCILVTAAFAGEMPATHRVDLVHYHSAHESAALQGVTELAWRDRATTFRESTRQVTVGRKDALYSAVQLSRRGKTVVVRAEDCPFSVGRDAACALNIGGTSVSRLHGALQHEGGKFYFRDDSRNGTFLTTGGEEVFLHAERFPLVAKGVISPGATLVQQTGDVIRYQCLTEDPGDALDQES
ncbi:MAG: FHA domain-containing protein [Pseudomonadota bacterium]